MPFFKKKPVVIDANQWDGTKEGADFIIAWGKTFGAHIWFTPQIHSYGWDIPANLTIRTLEGDMTAAETDWIIKGIKDEFYPCADEIFRATYEKINGGEI